MISQERIGNKQFSALLKNVLPPRPLLVRTKKSPSPGQPNTTPLCLSDPSPLRAKFVLGVSLTAVQEPSLFSDAYASNPRCPPPSSPLQCLSHNTAPDHSGGTHHDEQSLPQQIPEEEPRLKAALFPLCSSATINYSLIKHL